jgi:quercetin dioxygenase-like cupin family protein
MATRHAAPGEVVDLATWGAELPEAHSKTIARHERLELARIVLGEGESWGEHRVDGPVVIQCLSGRLRCRVSGRDRLLIPGRMLYLHGGEPHALHAEADSTALLTIVFVG